MRATIVFFLLVLAAGAQTSHKTAPHKTAPAPPPQMSHDFRTAGRRALAAIDDLARDCNVMPESSRQLIKQSTGIMPPPLICSDDDIKDFGKASKAIEEADAQHDNAVDKQAVGLLKEYNAATFHYITLQQERILNIEPLAYCKAGACEAMYATCKKEAEDAFETGVMPVKVKCKSLSPRDSQ